MRGTAVQFGAGNIGRGFIAQLFHESGLEVVFVDVASDLVEAINARGAYTIQIVGREAQQVRITGVRAIHGQDRERVAAEIAQAEIVCTAVGAGALPHIAPALASGLLARHQRSAPPLNVLLCENLHNAATRFRDMVAVHLPEPLRAPVLAQTGFVQTVVARMVPTLTAEERAADPLSIRVEAYKRLPADAHAVVGTFPPIVGVELVDNFPAWEARKLYTHNCAHAVIGYLGHRAGYVYGHEALRDPRITALLDRVMQETGNALIAQYGFHPQEHAAHVADLMERFRNESLGDTCQRLARDPIRKLAPGDRLVGAARLCEAQGIVPDALAAVIACALRYADPDDPSAPALQKMIREKGLHETLHQVSGIEPQEPLAARIHAYYTEEGP
ncbi:MAG: mannitol-1-phosphate 5-dehydrogenase [Chloroherpetonaceae bacterium]|nr:mannitol-1-phosphate 5-dehydrogenase [Chthonomonadaceae bacterium]MDW8207648.1 mannitol-1-phosphate 5-dehydrogenase [Chloroherpetonaceae bacterium]